MLKTFKKLSKRLPRRALTNLDILKHSNNIPYFRGVYMRDGLPKRPKKLECAIINLDSSENQGTHWVAYVKNYNYCEYFNSYGDLQPPLELITYLKGYDIFYNYNTYQKFDTVNCGHLCLKYLQNYWHNCLNNSAQ